MRFFVCCLFTCVLLACQSQVAEVESGAGEEEEAMSKKVALKDSIPPAKRSRYIVDTSRPTKEIKQQYPFDIAISDVNGQQLNTSTTFLDNGKPTVLLFWLTTCYPCRVELAAIKKEYPKWIEETDFNLYAISTDFQMNYESFIKTVKKSDWPFPAFHDTNREFRKVMEGGLNGLPQVFLLDKDGEIIYHKRKYSTGDEHTLYAQVKALAKK